jgi:hypothetical protein
MMGTPVGSPASNVSVWHAAFVPFYPIGNPPLLSAGLATQPRPPYSPGRGTTLVARDVSHVDLTSY